MKKNDLIKLLQDIPGNPDIVTWNGYTEDYQHISKHIDELVLVKHSKEFLTKVQRYQDSNFNVEKAFKKQEWELPNEFVSDEEFESWYGKNKKRVLVLSSRSRGKTYYDRLGSVEY